MLGIIFLPVETIKM